MKSGRFKRSSLSDRAFYIFNFVFWALIIFIVLYPLYLICIASISSPIAVNHGDVIWAPVDISWAGYEMVFANTLLWTSYINSIFYVIAGVLIAITITMLAAYVLSRQWFPAKTLSHGTS